MKKIALLALVAGTVIATRAIQKWIYIQKFWWLPIVKKGNLTVSDTTYDLRKFKVISASEYSMDSEQSKLNVLLEKEGVFLRYEATCDQLIKSQLIQSKANDFSDVIVTQELIPMTPGEANRWLNESDWGI